MSKINEYAIEKYTAHGYPRLFDEVGAEGLAVIQKHDEDAAKIVSEIKECDEVVCVGYSSTFSEYPDTITSFVDCKNGNRIYVVNRKIQK